MKNMFVRLLACLLMATMLIPCAAMAELDVNFDVPDFDEIFTPASGYVLETPEVPSVEWMHESGAIGFQVPEEWTAYDMEDGTGFPCFIAADGVGNMSIAVDLIEGVNMVPLFEELKQKYTELYEEMGFIVYSFELTSYGGRDAFKCEFEYLGVQQTQVMIQPNDYSAMITFGFAASAQQHVGLVMNSVWLDE